MAIKALMLRKKLEEMQARMAQFAQKTEELNAREDELTSALGEADNDEQMRALEEMVDTFTAE